jgi:hypothetical protein
LKGIRAGFGYTGWLRVIPRTIVRMQNAEKKGDGENSALFTISVCVNGPHFIFIGEYFFDVYLEVM